MRIATGGFYHETNSFGNLLVTPEVLSACSCEGQDWYARYRGVKRYNGGFIDEAEALGVQCVPTLMSNMLPSGPTTRQAFDSARDRLVELLYNEYQKQPYDGIALVLHGAGSAKGYDDVEGEILRAIREKMGHEIPIGVVLDLHGNITEEMIALSDIAIGVKCYPHVDEYDTARTMLHLLCNMVKTSKRPYKRLVKLPWLMTPAQGVTLSGPAHDVQQQCILREQNDPKLINATFFQGFPYDDTPHTSVSVLTMAETQECADRNALEIASFAWAHREDFAVPLNSAEKAVDLALSAKQFPVLIHESSDNPGGGAPGDGTHLLRELLKRNVPSAFGYIYDPAVAAQAAKAGVGATIRCRLGGKTDNLHGEPIELTDAYVKTVSDGEFILKNPMGKGNHIHLGTTVCLVVGNVSIVVGGDERPQTYDDGPFILGGIDWRETPVLAIKSSQHFKGWWVDKVPLIIPCESPGIQTADLTTLPFQKINKDFYPLGNARWEV